MSFNKKTWKDYGETGYEDSKINATNLNDLEDRIANALKESDWITLNSDYSCYYRKSSNIVELNMIVGSKTLEFGKNIVLGTLNEGYRPSKRIRTFVYNRSSSQSAPRNIYVEVQPTGSVYLFNWEASDTFEALSFSICFTI